MPTAWATCRMRAASSDLRWGESCLESLTPQTLGSSGRATAQTVTGPATEPLPTSSRPSTMPGPPISRMSAYMPSTRSRSARCLATRLVATPQALCTCARGSSAYRARSAASSSSVASASVAEISAAVAGWVVPDMSLPSKKGAAPQSGTAPNACNSPLGASRASRGCERPCPRDRAGRTAWRDGRHRDGRPRACRSWASGAGTCARRRHRKRSCGR